MIRIKAQPLKFQNDKNKTLLIPILGIALIIFIAMFLLLWLNEEVSFVKDGYLIPWIILLGFVIAIPNVYLYYKGEFGLFHPLVYAAWTYFIPAFFVGGLILASGISLPFYLTFVEDERYNLPLTLVYVILGYGGLSIGFFLPYGKSISEKIRSRLPDWDWKPENIFLPGILLLIIGIGNSIFAFSLGILGYQKVEAIGAYDGLIFLLTLLWLEASFILLLSVFRSKTITINHVLILGLVLLTSLTKSAFQGNRGSLVQLSILIACAFVFSGRQIELKHRITGAVMLVLAVIGGMIYGTTFRSVKQSEARVSVGEYSENIGQTFDKLQEQDLVSNLGEGVSALAERIEAVSSLAVVVSNYEKLEPYEESYGLKDNIITDSLYFFIPRPLWQNKPIGAEPRKYADLYFNYSENSFTITPMGDLLRNFGPVGVPLGMILLGFVLRIVYVSLIENQEFSFWRTTLFYMLLTSISYEGFYGTILPYLVKYGFVTFLGILFIRFFQPKPKNILSAEYKKTLLMKPVYKS